MSGAIFISDDLVFIIVLQLVVLIPWVAGICSGPTFEENDQDRFFSAQADRQSWGQPAFEVRI